MDPLRILVDLAKPLPAAEREDCVRKNAEARGFSSRVVSDALDQLARTPVCEVAFGDDEPESNADGVGIVRELKSQGPTSHRYSLKGEVGKGGMGKVFEVYDKNLRRTLAIKVLTGDDARNLERFVEEAQVTGQLDHPGIVPIHELGVDRNGRVFFSMQLVKGQTLKNVFDKIAAGNSEWNTTRVLGLLQRVCEAMAFSHMKGVIHRDLKPANIMVGDFGEVYVMDFGLARVVGKPDTKDIRVRCDIRPDLVRSVRQDKAKRLESERTNPASDPDAAAMTMDGDVIGTPCYMPPEQAIGDLEHIGPHSDVYAIGAVLYHLLYGGPPYIEPGEQPSACDVVERVVMGPPKPIDARKRNVPSELIAIVDKAMAREIEKRYATMTDLANDLRAYLECRVVSAHATGSLAELRKWVERNPAFATLFFLFGLALAGCTLLFAKKNQEIAATNRDLELANRTITAKDRQLEQHDSELARRRAQFDQLAAVVKLERALHLEEALYPPWPSQIAAMKHWLEDDAKELCDLRPALTTTVSTLESHATHGGSEAKPELEFTDPAELFLHDTLVGLTSDVSRLEKIVRPDVEKRLAWAKRISALSLHHPNARVSWEAARAAIVAADDVVASKRYATSLGGPIDLSPLVGLVPIGMNPATKLWEFYDLRSACDLGANEDPADLPIPSHRPDGSLEIGEHSGLVFVLVPGGVLAQGAQNSDPRAANFDPCAVDLESNGGSTVEVPLRPFLVSRYEMTQGQWARLLGSNPSAWMAEYPESNRLDRPIENVSWVECTALLSRFGYSLPSEAQWEYACRAGTATAFSFGANPADLSTHANVRERTFAESFANVQLGGCESWSDGEAIPCRVGRYSPNAFGLYDTHGNVSEWCADAFCEYSVRAQEGDGLRAPAESHSRIRRGGSYADPAAGVRASDRRRDDPTYRSDEVGCRPVRDLSNTGF